MTAVVNASPLIFLSKLDRLDLLPRPALTTPMVLTEIRAGHAAGHPEALSVEAAIRSGALLVKTPGKISLPSNTGLHPGESSVLALALDRRVAEVILDDRLAIRTAKLAGLKPVSTPFLIFRAQQAGRIDREAYRGLLARLLGHGYFLSAALYERLIAAAGEPSK